MKTLIVSALVMLVCASCVSMVRAGDVPASKPTTQPSSAPKLAPGKPGPTAKPAAPAAPAVPAKSAAETKADEQKAIKSTTPGAATPELLLKKSTDAWVRRDSKRFMACLDQSDSDLRVMAKGWGLVLDTLAAREELIRAMAERYGKDAGEPEEVFGGKAPKHGFEGMDAIADRLEDLDIEVKDDRAVAKKGDSKIRVEMVKVKDLWYLDDTKYTVMARANEDGITKMLILCKGLLDSYRAGTQLVRECKTLDTFKSRFRAAAVREMAPVWDELKRRDKK